MPFVERFGGLFMRSFYPDILQNTSPIATETGRREVEAREPRTVDSFTQKFPLFFRNVSVRIERPVSKH